MSKFFFTRFAWGNIKKNKLFYKPYLVTGALTAALFYIMISTANNRYLSEATGSMSFPELLSMGTVVIGIFSVIYMFYIDSFVMKRRQKELALYNVLGMEKRHVARMILIESFICWLIISVGGILCGMTFSKLVLMCLGRLMNLKHELKFCLEPASIGITFAVFGASILVTAIYHIIVFRFTDIRCMMNESSAGEKEPKSKWILTILGLLCLGTGYTIALIIKRPVEAAVYFMVAVILVIVGTYLLFITGSVTFLKFLKNRKSFYYKSNHFAAVSGLLFRMKQNAAGLASICILSTMVLVVISATVSMYAGVNSAVENAYSHDINIMVGTDSADTSGFNEKCVNKLENTIVEYLDEHDVKVEDKACYSVYSTYVFKKNIGIYQCFNWMDDSINDFSMVDLDIMTCDTYNGLTGQKVELDKGDVLIYSNVEMYDSIVIENNEYNIKGKLKNFPNLNMEDYYLDSIHMVMADQEEVDTLWSSLTAYDDDEDFYVDIYAKEYLKINMQYSGGDIISLEEELKDKINDTIGNINMEAEGYTGSYTYSVIFKELERQIYMIAMGGFLFIGIFFGIVFLAGTVVIIYFKQISEGYMDRDRYVIMQKVGMSDAEVKKTIHSQTMMIFFLPLITAAVHTLISSSMLDKLLALFAIDNKTVLLTCVFVVILVFAVMYGVIYKLTARIYYRIVKR
jgi:putative ABC transport system permease protein